MDILKTARKIFLFAIIIFVFSQIEVKSDTDSDIQKAFKDSYGYEAKAQYTDAIDALKNVYDAKSYEINLRLGWLYYLNKQYDESVQYYQNAITLMPYAIEPKLGIANPLAAAEKWDKLAEQYNAILLIDPLNSTANYRLGYYYYYKPDYQTAFKYFEKVANLYPFDYSSNLMFAWSNYQLGKSNEAKVLFNKVLLISPGDASAIEGLGLLNK